MGRKKKLGAGYRERKDGRIEYRWTEGGKRYSVTGLTIEECKIAEEKKKKRLSKNSYVRNADLTLDQYFLEWIRSRNGVVKEATLRKDKTMFTIISKTFGKKKISEIERREIIRFQESLKEDHSTTYSNYVIALLSQVLKSAVFDGVIEKNPCEGVRKLKRTEVEARETIHRALTVEETAAFFKAASQRNSWYYNLYDFLLHTGCRIGEAGALQRQDVDYKNGIIHIRRTITFTETGYEVGDSTKTPAGKRDIPMNSEIRAILQRQEQVNRDFFGGTIIFAEDRIFKSIQGGFVSGGCSIRHDMKAIIASAKLEYFSIHAFRDTFATRAIESGMNPKTLQTILGHASYSMTMDVYSHCMPNTKKEEMELLQIKTA